MKKNIVFMVLLLITTIPVYAAIGCMDDSYHLQKSNDHKTRHYVSCNCPCSQYKILSHDSRCLVCSHYHEPKQWVVVNGNKEIMTTEQYIATSPADNQTEGLPEATEKALTHMIAHYKKHRAYREESLCDRENDKINIKRTR